MDGTNPTYEDVSVCEEWLTYSKFKKWMLNQEHAGLELDKDIITIGNKLYSPEHCCFVNRKLNTLLRSRPNNSLTGLPLGVSIRPNGKFKARIGYNGKTKALGDYTTVAEAQSAYNKKKAELIFQWVIKLENPRIIDGLQRHIKELQNGLQ